jgi:hypothetical protein
MISHRWTNGKCICGCEVSGTGKGRIMFKDGLVKPYIECTRPIPVNSMHYHRMKNDYKMARCTGNGVRYNKVNLFI